MLQRGASKGATNNKERNTTFTGSISKAGPSAGARGPALDGAATAAGDDEPATDEEMQPAMLSRGAGGGKLDLRCTMYDVRFGE